MKSQYTSLNSSSQWEEIKQGCKLKPWLGIAILSQALVVKAIDLGDLFALMIASQDGHSAWVPDLKTNKQSDNFY